MAIKNIRALLDDWRSSFARLAPREKRMLAGLAGAISLLLLFLVIYLVWAGLDEMEENNSEMAKALAELEKNKESYLSQRARVAAFEVRMARTPLELNRFVETTAQLVGVSIGESEEIAPVKIDKYVQRSVEIKVRKVSIRQLAQLIKELEGGPHLVQITKLIVNTRWNQHEDLDVEMVVSTYERKSPEKSGTDTKKKNETQQEDKS